MKRDCDACGRSYTARSPKSKFCSDVECKRRRERERNRKRRGGPDADVIDLPTPVTEPHGALTAACLAELEASGVADSDAGRLVLLLAARLDAGSGDTGSAFAALSREYRAARADALKDAVPIANPVADLRAKAQERRLTVVG